jgi:hypothetical protein
VIRRSSLPIELRHREAAAHRRKEERETAVLALEPSSADEAQSVVVLVLDELWGKGKDIHWRALQGVARWLERSGAESPLWDIYLAQKDWKEPANSAR